MFSKKVAVAGHICLDITPLFPAGKSGRPDELLVPGTLLRMEGADVHTGGAVANTGLAMKKLGADVRLMGKVGDDAFGRMILDILAQHGCDSERGMIVSHGAVTSYSVVLAIPGIDRIFLHAPGANDSFGCEDIDLAGLKDVSLFHFGYPPLMRRMYEKNGEELIRLFRTVKGLGIVTSLDMAAVDPRSEAGTVDWRTVLEQLMPYVDLFLPSAEELCYMLDRNRWAEWTSRSGELTDTLDIERDIKPLADTLIDLGAGTVVIKCGAPGLYYRTGNAERLIPLCRRLELPEKDWINKEGFQKGFQPEKLRSATGAGDTSIAAFLTAMLEGRSLEECMRLAAATGAACVEAYDALSGIMPFPELEKRFFGK